MKNKKKKNTAQIFVHVLNSGNATGNWHRLNDDTSECQLTGATSAASMRRIDNDGNETLLKLKRKAH